MRYKIECEHVAHLRRLCDILKKLFLEKSIELLVDSPVESVFVSQVEFRGKSMQKFSSLAEFQGYADEVFANAGRELTKILIYCEMSPDRADLVQNYGTYIVSVDDLET